jgi:hypothetical protein
MRHSIFTALLSILICAATANIVNAQMFSVGNDNRPEFNMPSNEIYLGFEPTSVTYQGGEDAEAAGEFTYDAPLLRAGYSSRALNLFLGAGGAITGSDDVAYFDIGGNLNFGLPLYLTEKFSLQLPFRISSRLTNITNDQTVVSLDRFRFIGFTAGAGLKASARPKQNIRLQVGAIPSYGFTTASGGLFGGSLKSLALNGRLYFDRLFGETGLSLGYKYDWRDYDVDEQKYDYRVNGHSIQVGLTF